MNEQYGGAWGQQRPQDPNAQRSHGWSSGPQGGAYPPQGTPTPSSRPGTYTGQYRPYEPAAGRQPQPQQRPQQSTYQRYPQYQYSPSGGWQQTAKPEEKYRWNFEALDRASGSKGGKRKNRGLVVFSVCVMCALFVGLVTLAGYNLWSSFFVPAQVVVDEEGNVIEGATAAVDVNGDGVQLQISGRSSITETIPMDGQRMTTPQVAQVVRPAVVGIINYERDQFFGLYSEGSGIVMNDDGYIITNAHVVADAETLIVVLSDGDEIEAELIGADDRTDLAVIKIDYAGLTPAVFGDSNLLEVGETVIAIGNPAGVEFAGTVTQGIVSAVNRVVRTPYYQMNYIQTDAAINPGNSGGALCNEYGEVVGINSSKIVAEGYEGMGFAIPIAEAKPIIDELIRNGRVTGRVLLGITGQPVNEIVARNYNVPAGVQITSITHEELEERGVMRGDIITEIDGEPISDLNDIRNIIEGRSPGDTVTLTIYRQKPPNQTEVHHIEVVLIEDTGE